jgi:hypothetical protein
MSTSVLHKVKFNKVVSAIFAAITVFSIVLGTSISSVEAAATKSSSKYSNGIEMVVCRKKIQNCNFYVTYGKYKSSGACSDLKINCEEAYKIFKYYHDEEGARFSRKCTNGLSKETYTVIKNLVDKSIMQCDKPTKK